MRARPRSNPLLGALVASVIQATGGVSRGSDRSGMATYRRLNTDLLRAAEPMPPEVARLAQRQAWRKAVNGRA